MEPVDAEGWLHARYLPVALFTLKSALATSSGGKTLLVPTPYAIKMALLGTAIRQRGVEHGQQIFPLLRDLRVALRLPSTLIVINGFGRVRRPWEAPKREGVDRQREMEWARAQGLYPWNSTIAYREYVQFGGELSFAFALSPGTEREVARTLEKIVTPLLLGVNYLGRRGGFMQLADLPALANGLPTDYRVLTDPVPAPFGPHGDEWTMQVLDDCGPALTFDQANVYSPKRIKLGEGRMLRHVPLPLRLEQSSHGYSLYRRIE